MCIKSAGNMRIYTREIFVEKCGINHEISKLRLAASQVFLYSQGMKSCSQPCHKP